MLLADLGVSSMQLDDPARGFSWKHDGPLDMRMNPGKGQSAAGLLAAITAERLARLLKENADEPFAQTIGESLAGQRFGTARMLTARIQEVLSHLGAEEKDKCIRRTFQALRIAVNDEFSALKELLRQAPTCLKSGGRIAVLTFHSGEDRFVKSAFAEGKRSGVYSEVSGDVGRPGMVERVANPRSTAAKLRWAIRG
jgi:16S rRNA (cytosine1402-N4)-methyltransferase